MTEKPEISLPKELRIKKEQNPKCNEKGSVCGLYLGQDCCLKVLLDENGNFSGFEMVPCKKNPEQKIKVNL
jgi:hypothetical protein